MDEAEVRVWTERVERAFAACDTSSYYQLLGVPNDSPQDLVRQAYHRRAMQLHPDRHRETPEPTKGRVYALFKRMTEAYRVLSEPDLRRLYDACLARGILRLEDDSDAAARPKNPEEELRTPAGRQHYRSAMDALSRGDFGGADLNLKLAVAREGNVPVLAEAIEKLKAARKGG